MIEPKKTKKTAKKKVVKTMIIKPETRAKIEGFSYRGKEDLEKFLPEQFSDIHSFVKKFQNRFFTKLQYVHRFRSFKILKKEKHVDWISLNELMKRYDCRIPPVKMPLTPQRPYKENRIY